MLVEKDNEPVNRTNSIKEEKYENKQKVHSKTEIENENTFNQENCINSDFQPVLIGNRQYYYCEICKSKFIYLRYVAKVLLKFFFVRVFIVTLFSTSKP